jgi:fatty-acid desaturase
VTGLGVTIGFHRLLTHRSFTAAPALRVVLAIAGSMSFEGDVIGWVAIHRRHHAFADRPGDPHSPYRYGTHLAGLVRVTVLQHATWSVNSLCHVIGVRPFTTRRWDRATNLWPLALLSLGESWHNMHHSDPACARHGADPWQIDVSAAVIRIFERLGWATGVHWPDPARLDSLRRDQGQAR